MVPLPIPSYITLHDITFKSDQLQLLPDIIPTNQFHPRFNAIHFHFIYSYFGDFSTTNLILADKFLLYSIITKLRFYEFSHGRSTPSDQPANRRAWGAQYQLATLLGENVECYKVTISSQCTSSVYALLYFFLYYQTFFVSISGLPRYVYSFLCGIFILLL